MKIKKILITIVLMLIFVLMNTNNIFAVANATITLEASSTTIQPGKEVILIVTVKDINGFLDESGNEHGIIAFKGTLEYDKEIFEEVTTEEGESAIAPDYITGLNSWETPSFNTTSNELVTTRGGFVKTTQQIIQIKLKVKSTVADKTTTAVTLKDIIVSDDAQKLDKGTGTAASVNLTVQASTNPLDNTNTSTNTTNTTNTNITNIPVVNNTNTTKYTNTKVNNSLPQTGTTGNIMLVLIVVIAVNAFIAYIKYKKQ